MKVKGQIAVLFDENGLRITLRDADASMEFAEVRLNKKQTCQALSRLACTGCSIELRGLEMLGKRMEVDRITFEIGEDVTFSSARSKDRARIKAQQVCPEGWIVSDTFSSQDSFYFKDGKKFARATIRRWVDKTPKKSEE